MLQGTRTTITQKGMLLKALQADADTAGGVMVGGELLAELLKQMGSVSAVRHLARVLEPSNTEYVHVPTMEVPFSDATWTSELSTGNEDATRPFGARRLRPHPLNKRLRVSNKLLRVQPQADGWIVGALADALAVPQERAFLFGDGVGQPVGLLFDVRVPRVSVPFTAVGLIDWLYSLPARFQPQATILTSPAFVARWLKLTNTDLNAWDGRILTRSVAFSDQFPADFTIGQPIALVGDFAAGYFIQDSDRPMIQRLPELYAENNETGFIAGIDTDGVVVTPDAFRLLELGTP